MLVNIARYLSLDPESALKKTNRKFKRRFQWMEEQLRQSGRTPDQATAEELESLWQQAKTAGTSASLTTGQIMLRKCEALSDMHACVALQKEVWGFTDIELVPLRLFVVAEKIGGQVMGAFEGNDLVGFAFAVPGFRNRHAFLYSHMLAVRKDHRNSGLGRR